MPIPGFETFTLAILRTLADGKPLRWQQLREPCAADLGVTAEDLAERLNSGESRFDNRIQWANTYLAQAGLIARPQRGVVEITDRGREVLAGNPARVDTSFLSRFEEFQEFLNRSKSSAGSGLQRASSVGLVSDGTPFEAVSAAVQESVAALATEILERVSAQEPVFLERLVITLLSAMGYGGREGAVEHTGRSGDGGVDGVINQDALGLDRVYVQAKRYAAENVVGRPDMQAFVGALHGFGADRGVFITTSRFSEAARSYVERIPNRIVMIDGLRLAQLMIEYNVGTQVEHTFVIKRIDGDFFE